jgi:hypothetical protein
LLLPVGGSHLFLELRLSSASFDCDPQRMRLQLRLPRVHLLPLVFTMVTAVYTILG